MNMTQATHTPVAGTACTTCHEAGKSFYMGAASPGLELRPARLLLERAENEPDRQRAARLDEGVVERTADRLRGPGHRNGAGDRRGS